MFKTPVATKVISLAVLIALLFGSFPTAVAAAKDNNRGLEAKWARLIDRYNRQSLIHTSTARRVAQWLIDYRRIAAHKKDDIRKAVAKSEAAWAPAPSLVISHNGFDAEGNLVDKAAAQQSVKELSTALHRYQSSIRKLRALLRQYSLEG